MKRTGFRRPELPPRPRPVLIPRSEPARARMVSRETTARLSVPLRKEQPERDESYRRLVASFPCAICGVVGYSQCAHANTGKGAGIKAGDYDSFPLCCDRPGVAGCHRLFDQGGLMTKAERRVWEVCAIANTMTRAVSAGWQFKEAA